jgi:hypothetical protein
MHAWAARAPEPHGRLAGLRLAWLAGHRARQAACCYGLLLVLLA